MIACDAELQEKSQADIKKLAEMLQSNCEKAMKEYEEKLKEDPNFEGMILFTDILVHIIKRGSAQ